LILIGQEQLSTVLAEGLLKMCPASFGNLDMCGLIYTIHQRYTLSSNYGGPSVIPSTDIWEGHLCGHKVVGISEVSSHMMNTQT